MLGWSAGPVKEDVAPGVLEVEVTLPRRAEEASPVGLVQDGDDPATTTDELVARDLFHLEALQWCRYVLEGHGVGG